MKPMPIPRFAELSSRLAGEVETGQAMRRLYATDASEYQELPLAVAFPKTEEDVRELLHFARQHAIGVIPRTAGTSLAGQVVGSGLVMDFSRHFRSILSVDKERRRVRVQPGVVRNELNTELAKHGLFFAPETSTANRAMIGGMVGNNSCGANSMIYGSVREHLLSARGLFADGSAAVFGPLTPSEFETKCALPDHAEGRVYRAARDLLADPVRRRLISENFPRPSIPRRNTGYALDLLMDAASLDPESPKPFNFCKLLAGSEGTLFVGLEFELNCSPLPPRCAALVCGHFASVDEALRANLIALGFAPTACELIDRHVLTCTKGHLAQQRNRAFVQGDPEAILVVELRGDVEEEVEGAAASLQAAWQTAGLGYAAPVLRGAESQRVWDLRRAGQGLLSNIPGDAKPRAVVEDTAVDVRDLPAYIAAFDTILREKHGIDCVYYAHAGSGELHTRPIFDLKSEQGVRTFRAVAQDIAHLVKKYRGSLSGEHGDGRLRGEFIPLMVGESCYAMMRSIKQIFDPDQILNPGKIIDTPPMDSSLRYAVGSPTPEYPTFFDFSDVGGVVRATEKCTGSADCRKSHAAGGAMCPSYMVTREEKHSTRARANILRHALTHPTDPTQPFAGEEITEVMDLCLSCKACKNECPSSVDIARLKAEWLQHHHETHGIPLRSRIVAGFASVSRLTSLCPSLSNALLQTPWIRRIINRLIGFHPDRTLPRINPMTFRDWFRSRTPLPPLQPTVGRLLLFCDEFTNYNDLEVGIATVELLELLGYELLLPEHEESGRAALSKGLLRRARKLAESHVRQFSEIVSAELPLVGMEPSALLGFRDEYPSLVAPALRPAAKTLAAHCLLLEEFLVRELQAGRIQSSLFTTAPKTIHLHGHCHQKALASLDATIQMLSLPEGFVVRTIPSGCCGMAGAFGYEAEHFQLSMQVGELILFPSVRSQPPTDLIAASGTSCRHQIRDGTSRQALHPAQILRAAVRTAPSI